MIPTGKGCFIWQLSKCAGGDPVLLASKAVDLGLSWVAIKAADGVADFNQGGATWQGPDLLAGAIAALRAVGIKCVGWQYIYGANKLYQSIAAREAEIAVGNISRFGFDCWIIDPEGEYKRYGAAAWAATYMNALRASFPQVSIGLCSYRYPTLHPELPWGTFLAHTDFHCPQVYWIGSHNPGYQLQRSYTELNALKALPLIPVGSAYYVNMAYWVPTVADLDEFDAKAHELNLPGVTWWEWGENGRGLESNPAWWAAIRVHDWGQPIIPPVQSWEQRVDAFLRPLGFTGPGPE